jgi:hypothetical protein
MTGRYTAIEVFRQAWGRFAHKEALLFYPLFLAVLEVLAFFALYLAEGGRASWSEFLNANYDRMLFVHDHFISGISSRPAFFFAVLAGLILCLLYAVVRAPYFRAIAGPGYPLAPRSWGETGHLALFYLASNLVLGVLPLATPGNYLLGLLIQAVVLVISVLIVFADYVIVYERLSFVSGLRRSYGLVAQNALPVVIVIVVYWLIAIGLHQLYGLFYNGSNGVFFLLPLSQILVQAFLVLFFDLVLILLYQRALLREMRDASDRP